MILLFKLNRLWQENTGQGFPREPRAELVRMTVDGNAVTPTLVATNDDRHYVHALMESAGTHRAEVEVRELQSGRMRTLSTTW